MSDEKPKSRRGGARPGAGRKPKGHKPASIVGGIDYDAAMAAPVPDDIETEAQKLARVALGELVKLMTYAKSESARVNAACDVLDRGYGKPSADAGGLAQFSLFTVGTPADLASEIRTEARKHANLALEVLKKVGMTAESDAARRQANKALLDRGLGMVAAAKLDQAPIASLGKKEEADRAAKAATRDGPFAPRRMPSVAMN